MPTVGSYGVAVSYERGTPVPGRGGAVFNVLGRLRGLLERDFFIDNLLVRIHFIIVMIRWTGLAPWELEFPFPGSLTSTFLAGGLLHGGRRLHGGYPFWGVPDTFHTKRIHYTFDVWGLRLQDPVAYPRITPRRETLNPKP